ncbi:MAG: hypothetical protein H0U27_08510 [Nitrosopumilus sp.]|nr:hypothetical protein [Nitrosopumilus sp.]
MIEILKWGSQVVQIVDVALEAGDIHQEIYGDDAKEKLTQEEKIDLGFRIVSVAFKSMTLGIEVSKMKLGDKCPNYLKNFQVLTVMAPELLKISKPFVKGDKVSIGKVSWALLVCVSKAKKHQESNMSPTSGGVITVVCDLATCVGGGVRLFKYARPKEFDKVRAKTNAKMLAMISAIKRIYNKYFVMVFEAENKKQFDENVEKAADSTDIKFTNFMLFSKGTNLDKIPPLLVEDDFFMGITCKISGEPIRYVVQPKQSDGILYERKEIEQYLKKAIIPPIWPEGLKFSHANIEPNYVIQLEINNHLNKLSDEAKKTQAEFEEFEASLSKQ